MIPTEITLREFLNSLFSEMLKPLEERNFVTMATRQDYPYPYTWPEITEFIDNYFEKISIEKLDKEKDVFNQLLNSTIQKWYEQNTGGELQGRVGYEDDLEIWNILDSEDTQIHTKLREYVWNKIIDLKKREMQRIENKLGDIKEGIQNINKQQKKIKNETKSLKIDSQKLNECFNVKSIREWENMDRHIEQYVIDYLRVYNGKKISALASVIHDSTHTQNHFREMKFTKFAKYFIDEVCNTKQTFYKKAKIKSEIDSAKKSVPLLV